MISGVVAFVVFVSGTAIAYLFGYMKGMAFDEKSRRRSYRRGWDAGIVEGLLMSLRKVDALASEIRSSAVQDD